MYRRKSSTIAATWAIAALCGPLDAALASDAEELQAMSLEQLLNVEVTSVSKRGEALRHAPASVYVITREEILRAGANSVAEALRLAPNLEVRQHDAKNFTVAARGMAGNANTQSFANKLLVLIDGRSVYSPLFSGVYFDAQDVVLADIDRIEIISGPGATLWGANAMHGVVNIITRRAVHTQGAMLVARGGNLDRDFSARYGGRVGGADYRVYGKVLKRDSFELADGTSAQDDWHKSQVGWRLDWSEGRHGLTFQGDAYRAHENQLSQFDLEVVGANALTRWTRGGEHGEFKIQAYFDYTKRAEPLGGLAFIMRTFDIELQHAFEYGRHNIVWGLGERLNRYDIMNAESLLFVPDNRSLNIGNVFVHDTIALGERLSIELGLKAEEDPYSGWEWLPDLRASWRVGSTAMLWAAASRAIRSPTPFDVDVLERLGPIDYLAGNPDFEPEQVNAYELGYRSRVGDRLSWSLALFYHDYDDLRTVEPTPTTVLPLRWGNRMRGSSYGLEAWGKWQVTDWWRLSPGVRALHKNLRFDAGASELLGIAQAGNDPSAQALLGSTMEVGRDVTWDFQLRYVGRLRDPYLKQYYELNTRVGWQIDASLEAGIGGKNLLHSQHREAPADFDAELERGFYLDVRWSF